jgi:site-specific DNA recombinase
MGKIATNRYYAVKPERPRDEYTAQRARSTRQRPMSEWRYVEIDQRIVTPELWEQAQARLTPNQKFAKRNAKHEYLLAGLLRCGCPREGQPEKVCGRAMYGTWPEGRARIYRCNRGPFSDAEVNHHCRGRILADDAEARTWGKIAQLLSHPKAILGSVVDMSAQREARRAACMAQLRSARARHADLAAQLVNAFKNYNAGKVKESVYDTVRSELETALAATEAEIDRLEAELTQASADEMDLNGFLAYCDQFRSLLAGVGQAAEGEAYATKQAIIRKLVREARVFEGGRIELTIGASAERVHLPGAIAMTTFE